MDQAFAIMGLDNANDDFFVDYYQDGLRCNCDPGLNAASVYDDDYYNQGPKQGR